MEPIDLDNAVSGRRTVCLYGGTRTGKTHFAATAPRPLFISDATESGWTTIAKMDRSLWWEPDVKPIVWPISSVPEMAQAFARAVPLVQAGTVRSVFIDSLSFYADQYLAYLYNLITNHDTRKIYGELGIHLRDLRVKWHSLPCNVGWLCLSKDPDEENKVGGPLIPGQQAAKFTAGVDNILYFRESAAATASAPAAPAAGVTVAQAPAPAGRKRFIHTKRYGNYIAGGREGSFDVQDPLAVPTWRGFLAAIGEEAPDVNAPVPSFQIASNANVQATAAPKAAASQPRRVIRAPVPARR